MSAAGASAASEVVVHSRARAGDRALLLELRALDAGALPDSEPGAHIDLHMGQFVRQYSLLDTSGPSRYVVCVQYEPDGRGGSRHIHRHVHVGDRLHVSAPRNTFRLDPNPHHAVLLAGGIGVTPLLSMTHALHQSGASCQLHCYSRGAIPLRQHIEAQPYRDSVTFYDTRRGGSLRRAEPNWTLRSDTVVYACGPTGFLEAVRRYATDAGISEERIRRERFVAEQPVDRVGDAFTVVAASTGERMAVAADESIAEVLRRHGYEVALSCEEGICGSCLTNVLGGVPDHRDEVQTAAEHASNTQINVCVSRSRSAILTLEV